MLEFVAHFKKGVIEVNPLRNIDLRKFFRESREPIVLPTPEAIDKMVKRCPVNFGRAIRFLEQTGMREEEAFGLEW